jgi:hypothetical protein
MPWFSVRAVYMHERQRDGAGIFEERILLFRASDAEQACALAENESQRYLRLNPTFQRVGEWIAFAIHLDGEELNGSEIWSGLSSSGMAPEEYYKRRYTEFEFQPDGDDEPIG